MKKSWSPQYRCKLLFNPLIWGIFICIAACVSLVMYMITRESTAVIFVVGAVYICYCAYLERQRWEIDGYRTISLDDETKMIIFDNKINVPFRLVDRVVLNVEEPPEPTWMTRRKINEKINDFNGFFEFYLKTGEKITIAVQFRTEAQDIIENLRDCGVIVQMSESDKYDVTGMYQLAWNLIWIVPAVIWFLWKLFINR